MIRHIEHVFIDLLRVEALADDRANGLGIGADEDAQLSQDLLRNGAGGHPANGLSSGGPASAPVVPEAIFGEEAPVGVSGPKGVRDVAVIPGVLILIANQKGNGRPGGLSLEDAGENLDLIVFSSLACERRPPGSAPIQEDLNAGTPSTTQPRA